MNAWKDLSSKTTNPLSYRANILEYMCLLKDKTVKVLVFLWRRWRRAVKPKRRTATTRGGYQSVHSALLTGVDTPQPRTHSTPGGHYGERGNQRYWSLGHFAAGHRETWLSTHPTESPVGTTRGREVTVSVGSAKRPPRRGFVFPVLFFNFFGGGGEALETVTTAVLFGKVRRTNRNRLNSLSRRPHATARALSSLEPI